MTSFTVHGVPQPAGSKRGFVHPHTGRAIVIDANTKAKPWKAQVADAAVEAMNGTRIIDGPIRLSLTFFMPRPKSHYRTGKHAGEVKPGAPKYPASKPDVLKLARAVEDALTGVVYADDALIVSETLLKMYTNGTPRVEITIAEMPGVDPVTRLV